MSATRAFLRLAAPGPAAGLVLAGAGGAILAALAFEHVGGYLPCPLCLQQRWAYYAGIPLALAAWALAGAGRIGLARGLLLLVGLGFAANAVFGAYHSGIEWGWWPGPAACALPQAIAADPGALLQGLGDARLVPCDAAPWRFLGLSFAGWNAAISAGLAALALAGGARPHGSSGVSQ